MPVAIALSCRLIHIVRVNLSLRLETFGSMDTRRFRDTTEVQDPCTQGLRRQLHWIWYLTDLSLQSVIGMTQG